MKFVGVLVFLVLIIQMVQADEPKSLQDVVLELQSFQSEINQTLLKPKISCQIGDTTKVKDFDKCSVMNYCQKFKDQMDSPYILKNKMGEVIVNDIFFKEQNVMLNCLKGKYSEDIRAAVDEFSQKKKAYHLKEVFNLNQQLKVALKKNNELAKYAEINQEIIQARLLQGMDENNEEVDLKTALENAEKKLKIKLSIETKNILIKIESLINNPNYEIESKKFEASFFKLVKPDDLFSNIENFTNVDVAGSEKALIENQKKYNMKAQEVYQVFSDAKNKLIEYLNKKKTFFNKREIERSIERVNLVKFRVPVLGEDFAKICENPTAWFSSNINTVSICPGWFNRPKINLFETFTHELSHSIDPCNLSAPMNILKSKADQVENGPFDVNIKMTALNQTSINIGSLDDLNLKPTDQKLMKIKLNPFKKVIECLESKDSIGATAPDKERFKRNIDNELNELIKLGRNNSNDTFFNYLKNAKDNLDQYFDQYAYCNIPVDGGLSQVEESFADKIASEVVALQVNKLSKDEASAEIEKMILSEMNSDDLVCAPGEVISKIKQKGIDFGCTEYFANKSQKEKMAIGLKMSSEYNSDPHPPISKRLERIILTHPILRSKLGCKVSGAKYCED